MEFPSVFQCLCCCLSALLVFTLTPAVITDVISPPLLPVEFHCHGTGNLLTWLVDGSVLNGSEKQNRQITITNTSIMTDTLSSDLTIIALPINDGIEIGCIVAIKSPYIITHFDEILLKIRGISFVRNVTLNFRTLSYDLLISWSPPVYHSDDIPDSLNYTYQVIASDEIENRLLINNVSSTFAKVANITKCDTIDVTIIAFLDQYTSNSSTIRTNGSYANITFQMCQMHQNLIVEFNYLPSLQSCPSLLSIDIETEDKIGIAHHQSLIIFANKSDKRLNFTLSPFKHYQMAIVIETLQQGTKIYQNHTNFSTFNVQDFYVSSGEYTNGSVRVQCLYDLKCDLDIHDEESTVKKCLIVFENDDGSFNRSISGPSEKLVTLPASGNYTVTVYDIIDDFIVYGPSGESKQIELIVINTNSTATPTASATPTCKSSTIAISNTLLLIGMGGLVLFSMILMFIILMLLRKRRSFNISKKKKNEEKPEKYNFSYSKKRS